MMIPHSPESEKTILGIALAYPDKWAAVSEGLSADDFYDPINRLVFEKIVSLRETASLVDAPLVVSQMLDSGEIRDINEQKAKHILGLTDYGFTTASIKFHSDIVRSKAALRNVITSANEMIQSAMSADAGDVGEFINRSRSDLAKISSDYQGGCDKGVSIVDGIKNAFERAAEKPKEGDVSRFIPLGIAGIKVVRKVVSVLAGRPSNGKTVTGDSMSINAARAGAEVLHFNNEDSDETLSDRRLANIGGIDHGSIINQTMSYEDYNRGVQAIVKAENLPLTSIDCRGKTVDWISAKAAAHRERVGKLDLVVIDYFQNMKIKGKMSERYAAFSDAVMEISNMTNEIGCATLLLSQLKRPSKDKHVDPPWIDELRETGVLEQVAKKVILVHYPFFYNDQNKEENAIDTIRLHVAKDSSGLPFVKWVKADMPRMRIYDDTIENPPPSNQY